MRKVKRLEIVTGAVGVPEVQRILEACGVGGYTMINPVGGWGHRGTVASDELTSVFQNVYFLVACSDEEATRVGEKVRPVLRRLGGICLVSEAESLI